MIVRQTVTNNIMLDALQVVTAANTVVQCVEVIDGMFVRHKIIVVNAHIAEEMVG